MFKLILTDTWQDKVQHEQFLIKSHFRPELFELHLNYILKPQHQ